ncbi:MAG: Tfp pilus assembly protein PilF [Cognaticolwellia sp.]|jgi:Tfp pilus assembly protein PilF
MARCTLLLDVREGEIFGTLSQDGAVLAQEGPMDLVPSNVTQAIFRQLLLEPAKRRLLPASQVKSAGQLFWGALASIGDALLAQMAQGPTDLVIQSESAEILDLPWEALRPEGQGAPVRSGRLEILRSKGALSPDAGPSPTPLLVSLSTQVDDLDAWQHPILEALQGPARKGHVALRFIQEGGLSFSDAESLVRDGSAAADTAVLDTVLKPSGLLESAESAGLGRALGLHAALESEEHAQWLNGLTRALTQGGDLFAALRATRMELEEAGAFAWMQPVAISLTHAGPVQAPAPQRENSPLRQAQLSVLRKALVLGESVLIQGPAAQAEPLLAQALVGVPHLVLPARQEGLADELAMALGIKRSEGPGANLAFSADLRRALEGRPVIAIANTPGSLVPELGALASLGATLAISSEEPVESVEPRVLIPGPLNPTELLRLKLSEPAFVGMTPELWDAMAQACDGQESLLGLLPAWLSEQPDRVSELQPDGQILEQILEALPDQLRVALHSAGGMDLPESVWVDSPLPFAELKAAGWMRRSLLGWRTLPDLPFTGALAAMAPADQRARGFAKLGRFEQSLRAGLESVQKRVQATASQAAIALAQELLRAADTNTPELQASAVPILAQLASAHEQLSEHQMALSALENAAAWAPNDGEIQRRLGAALGKNGEFQRALSILEPLKDDPEAHLEIALLSQDSSAALAAMERASDTVDATKNPRLAAEILGHQARLSPDPIQKRALAQARVDLDPTPQALTERAELHREDGELDKAGAMHALRLQNADLIEQSGAHFDLSRIALERGENMAALAHLEQAWALALDRHRSDAIAGVGALLGQLLASADRTRAIEVLQRARGCFEELAQDEQARSLQAMIHDIQGGAAVDGGVDQALAQARAAGENNKVASLQFNLAQKDLQKGELGMATVRLEEAWGLVHRAENDEGRSAIGFIYAQLLAREGRGQVAVAIAGAAMRAAQKLEQGPQVERLTGLLARLDVSPEQVLEQARAEKDLPRVAALQYQLGSRDLQIGQHAQASLRIAESYRINVALDDSRGISVVGAVHGQLLSMQGQRTAAKQVFERALQAARSLSEDKLVDHIQALLGQVA